MVNYSTKTKCSNVQPALRTTFATSNFERRTNALKLN